MSAMIERLEKIENRYKELSELMMDPKVLGDRKSMAKLGKEQASLTAVVDAYDEYKVVAQGIEDANEMLKDGDYELVEMAKMELEELEPKKQFPDSIASCRFFFARSLMVKRYLFFSNRFNPSRHQRKISSASLCSFSIR